MFFVARKDIELEKGKLQFSDGVWHLMFYSDKTFAVNCCPVFPYRETAEEYADEQCLDKIVELATCGDLMYEDLGDGPHLDEIADEIYQITHENPYRVIACSVRIDDVNGEKFNLYEYLN